MDGHRRTLSFLVDATGTSRRLRALVAIGYGQPGLAQRLGISVQSLSLILLGHQKSVDARLRSAVADLFVDTWSHPINGPSGERSRTIARAHGWFGPLAWDDIDDPASMPNVDGGHQEIDAEDEEDPDAEKGEPEPHLDEIAVERALRGERVRLTQHERMAVVTELHSRHWNDHRIARALHIDPRSVLRIRKHQLKLPAWPMKDQEQDEYA